MQQKRVYDAVIVGSGAAGGIAAHVLVNRGLNVILLEIGSRWDPTKDYITTHKWPYEMPFRGFGKPGQYDGLWKINAYTDHLYVNPRVDKYALAPGTGFHWTRIHAVGGRTNTWGRVSLRFSEADFKPKSMQDGYGDDWPIEYKDLAPYYDRVETLMGVYGTREGLAVLPDGIYMPPPPMRCGELRLKAGCKKLNIPAIPNRVAVLTKNYNGRAACHYCGECDRGCDTSSRFSTLDAIIPSLLSKPNFTLRTQAAAHRVLVDTNTGKASGISFIDTQTRQEHEIYGRTVVLGAGAMESTRILLNSKNREYPNGLANSSGVVGHYLMDSIKSGFIGGYLPELKGAPVINEDGAGGGHIYIPRHTNLPGGRNVSVKRGWQFQPNSGSDIFPGFANATPGFRIRFQEAGFATRILRGLQWLDSENRCRISTTIVK